MILRTTFDNGEKQFTDLGETFRIIDKTASPKKFDLSFGLNYKEEIEKGFGLDLKIDIIALLTYSHGGKIISLFRDQTNELLNDNGSVFELINYAVSKDNENKSNS